MTVVIGAPGYAPARVVVGDGRDTSEHCPRCGSAEFDLSRWTGDIIRDFDPFVDDGWPDDDWTDAIIFECVGCHATRTELTEDL